MKKTVVTLIAVSILSVTIAAPVFAHGWGGHSREGVSPLWPIAAALVLPAAILGGVVQLAVPEPARYAYVPQPVPVEPEMYPGPDTFYYAPRVYAAPPEYYAPGAYYSDRHHRGCR